MNQSPFQYGSREPATSRTAPASTASATTGASDAGRDDLTPLLSAPVAGPLNDRGPPGGGPRVTSDDRLPLVQRVPVRGVVERSAVAADVVVTGAGARPDRRQARVEGVH